MPKGELRALLVPGEFPFKLSFRAYGGGVLANRPGDDRRDG